MQSEPEQQQNQRPESASAPADKDSQRLRSWVSSPFVFGFIVTAGTLIIAYLIAAPFYSAQRRLAPRGVPVERLISYHDLVEHYAVMKDFDKTLRSGIAYPRWLSDFNKGYGIAWPNFYPPGFYFLASFINSIVGDWLDTLFLASVLGLSCSGLALYLLSRLFYGRLASVIAAILYMVLPFHVMNLYWQGAMPQFTGFVFIPLVIYFAYKTGSQGKLHHYAGLGLVYGLYILTHLPLAFLMSYALAFYAIAWAIVERDWKLPVRIMAGMMIGLLLSAIYWLPALLEARYAYENVTAIFPYQGSYLLLLPPGDEFVRILNHAFMLQSILLLASIIVVRAKWKGEKNAYALPADDARTQTRLWVVMGIATTFMTTSLSIYISSLLPKIEVAAFAWRWVAVTSLFVCLLLAAAIERLLSPTPFPPRLRLACFALMGLVILLNVRLTVRPVMGGAITNPTIKPTEGLLESNYTPKDAKPPTELSDSPLAIVSGGLVQINKWEPQFRHIFVSVERESQLRLKTYNFPGWTARIDGQPAQLSSDTDGAQVIIIPQGGHNVEVEFVNTPVRDIGAICSAFGLFLIVGLAFAHYAILATRRWAEEEKRSETALSTSRAKGMILNRRTIGFALAVAAAGLIIIMFIRLVGNQSTGEVQSLMSTRDLNRDSQSSSQNRNTVSQGEFVAGGNTKLYVRGRVAVMVAVDSSTLDQLIDALSQRNLQRVDALIGEGKVFNVPNDTPVRVLASQSGKVKVQILEGDSRMLEGWVPDAWLR